MKKATATAAIASALLLISTQAQANPVPSYDELIHPIYWLVRTLPFDYAVDIAALCAVLLLFGQSQGIAWKMVPLYNVVVVIAGYLSDLGARVISGYPAYHPTASDPIMGPLMRDDFLYPNNLSEFTFRAGVGFMATVAVLIYLLNLVIIHYILRLNDIDSRGRLHLAAAIMAIVTSPYIALRGNARDAWFVPILMTLIALGAALLVRHLRRQRRLKAKAR